MKAKHRVAAGASMAAALALSASVAQATEEDPSYRFRLVNNFNVGIQIQCDSGGNSTHVAIGVSIDITCDQQVARSKPEGKNELSHTHNCSSSRPIMRIEYKGYWIGLNYRTSLIEGCRSS